MSVPGLTAFAPCYGCGRSFWFDPDRVPSITAVVGNRQTGEGARFDPDAPAQPICPSCAKRTNVMRRANGLPPMYEGDTVADQVAGHRLV